MSVSYYVWYCLNTSLQSSVSVSNVTCEENLEYTSSVCYSKQLTYITCPFITCECNHSWDALLERPVQVTSLSCHCLDFRLCLKRLLTTYVVVSWHKPEACSQIDHSQVTLQPCSAQLFLRVKCHETSCTFNQQCTLISALHKHVRTPIVLLYRC